MFSPRKSRKTVDKQSMLLTDTSYDKDKAAEFHKHVTEVSDDESVGVAFTTPTNGSLASPAPRSSNMKQRFIRLGKKKQSNRDPSLPPNVPFEPTGVLQQSHSPSQEMHPTSSEEPPEDAVHLSNNDGALGKYTTSFDTMGVADDSSSTASTTIQNSFSMQSGASIHDLDCSGEIATLPAPCDFSKSPGYRGVDNVVSVRVVDGFAQMQVSPVFNDLSSDDECESASDEDVFASTILDSPKCDLNSLFFSKHKFISKLTDEASSASFEFSAVNFRSASPDQMIAAKGSLSLPIGLSQPAMTEQVEQTSEAGPDSDGDDPFDNHMSFSRGVEDSFDLHSQSSDFDLLDVSFVEESLSSAQPYAALVASRKSASRSLFERPNRALAKAMSQSSLSDDANAHALVQTSEDFDFSFNFDWVHPPQNHAEALENEMARKAPQRSGSHLSEDSQQRIKEYLTKDRKNRPSSNGCRSVGFSKGRKPKASSYKTSNVSVSDGTQRISHPRTGRTRSSSQSTRPRKSELKHVASPGACTSPMADFKRGRPRIARQKMVELPSPRRSNQLLKNQREALPSNTTISRRRRASVSGSVSIQPLEVQTEPIATNCKTEARQARNSGDKAALSMPRRKVSRRGSCSTEVPKGRPRGRSESRARSCSQPPNVNARKPLP